MELPELRKHPAREIFYKKGVARCARHLKVSPGHLRNILNGVQRSSYVLGVKIESLFSALQQKAE